MESTAAKAPPDNTEVMRQSRNRSTTYASPLDHAPEPNATVRIPQDSRQLLQTSMPRNCLGDSFEPKSTRAAMGEPAQFLEFSAGADTRRVTSMNSLFWPIGLIVVVLAVLGSWVPLVRVTAVIRVSQRGECREGKLRTSVTDQLSSGCSPVTRRFR
jgi:hypothetical protein